MIKIYLAKIENYDTPGSRDGEVSPFVVKKGALQHEKAWELLSLALSDVGISVMPEIKKLPQGKPVFSHTPGLDFSISHSDEICAAVLSDEGDIGIDIQCINQRSDPDRIGKRFFSPAEYKYLSGLRDEYEKRQTFFRIFSAKEAFVKMTGEGMRRDFTSFTVSFAADLSGTVLNEKKCIEGYILNLPTSKEAVRDHVTLLCTKKPVISYPDIRWIPHR